MNLHLILVWATFIPLTEAQERIRELENRLRPFPSADIVSKNAALSREYMRKLDDAVAVIPAHRRDAFARQQRDARELWVFWHSHDKLSTLLREAKVLADQGRTDNRRSEKVKTIPEFVRTVPEMIKEAELYIRILEKFLGEENFCVGRMPPPLPYWHFRPID